MKILLSGATGFIGSHIAKKLLENGFEIYATYRNSSSFEKCSKFKRKINWINTQSNSWKEKIEKIRPDQFIHVAWSGIEADERNNWEVQISNFWISKNLFDIAEKCGIKKVIALGSQAEYGIYPHSMNETIVPQPVDAYGAIKTLTLNYLRNLCENSATEWYWIRVFSVFGEYEKSNWLIPSVISGLLKNEPIQLTSCEQQYNYLYIEDFAYQLLSIVRCAEDKSGIYNICNTETISLREILIQIAYLMGVSQELLHFGAIQLRPGQNMLIAGDNLKFRKHFPDVDDKLIGLTQGLIKTIKYYKHS